MNACVIGSFRKHYNEILEVIEVFHRNNITVLSPKVSTIIDENVEFVILESDNDNYSNERIQLEVFKNFKISDFVYVYNPSGFVGNTVCFELGVLIQMDTVKVYYKEYPKDLPIYVPNGSVISVEDLITYINGYGELPKIGIDNEFAKVYKNKQV